MYLNRIGPRRHDIARSDFCPLAAFRLRVELNQSLHDKSLGFSARTNDIGHLEQLNQGNEVFATFQGKINNNGFHRAIS